MDRSIKNTHEIVTNAIEAFELNIQNSPDSVIEWARRLEINFPEKLVELVDRRWTKRGPPPATAPEGAPAAAPPAAVPARERESMLKLIIGMAVAGYRYDPTARRNDSVRDITNDLEKHGVALSDDTIRKFLREGAELLPAKQSKGS